MAYPQLARKIEILDKKFGIDPAKIAQEIHKDKSTAWRWLSQQSERLRREQQAELVAAICKILRTKVKLSDQMFRGHNPLKFCLDAGLTKLEAAHYNQINLPVPEILIDSLFDFSKDTGRFNGHYLQYRVERELGVSDRPYIQGSATIAPDEDQRVKYKGSWCGHNSQSSYEGFVFSAGTQINVVGECSNPVHAPGPEVWWCALRPSGTDPEGKPRPLSGYLSDFTQTGKLYTDRIVLVRCAEDEHGRVRDRKETYVDRARLVKMAGQEMAEYLDDWLNVPI